MPIIITYIKINVLGNIWLNYIWHYLISKVHRFAFVYCKRYIVCITCISVL